MKILIQTILLIAFTYYLNAQTCVNNAYTVTLGGSEYGGLTVQSVTLTPSDPEPNETVVAEITWVFSGASNIVKGNVYGDWNTSTAIDQIFNGIDGSQTVTKTVTFTAPSSEGSHKLRFNWAYDIGGYADYDLGNLPTSSQCSTWGNSTSVTYDHAFDVETSTSSNFSEILTKKTIYPNPTKGKFVIVIEENANIEIVIFNLLGRSIYNETLGTRREIDISSCNPGIYFVKIKDSKGNILLIEKVVKE